MATIQFENGTKVQFDGNPTPKDVEEVATKLNMKSGTTPAPAPSAFSPTRQADMAAREKYSAIAAPNTENPSVLGEATKTVANIPTSAWNFAKGALDLINPISIAGRIKEIGSQFGGLSKESGGALPALAATAKELPKTAYEAVIPEAGRGIVSAIHGGFTGNTAKVDEGLKTAQRAVVSDPVGQIAPFLIAGRVGAKGLDTAGVTKGAGAGFDATVSKVAAPVINTVKSATEGVSSFVRGGTKFGVSQATGLKPTTIETITDQPKAVKVAKTSGLDRTSVGQEVQGAIARRAKNLDQTGAAYAPVRESNAPVVVSKGWIENAIKDTTGLNIKKGKITGTGASALRDAGDIRAIQHLYDLWRPVFNRGTMTANEFLNFRQDLAALSKFERQIGKSHPVENAAKNIRKSFNTSFRAQLKGLDKLDARFSKQTAELKELSKGLVDREGNLTDAGLSKIANLSKTKPKMYAQLEELVPGIEKKVRVVQAIEDIQNASGIKVGTYGRAALTGGAYFAGGPIGAVVTAILTSPEAAVPILRGYGLLKNANAVRAVVNALKSTGAQINQLPNNAPVALKKDVKDVPVRMGLSIENVSGGKPSAFGPKSLSTPGTRRMPTARYTEGMKTSAYGNEKIMPERYADDVRTLAERYRSSSKVAQENARKFSGSRGESTAKGIAMRDAAILRKLREEATPTEIANAKKYLESNYVGKAVEFDGKPAILKGTAFGRIKIQLQDGTIKNVEKEKIKSPMPTNSDASTYLKEQAKKEAEGWLKLLGK